MATATLGSKAVGSIIKLKENGVAVDYIVCKHNYETGLNGAGRTCVVRKDCHSSRQWHTSNVNAYASSALDSWLNSTFLNLFDADTRAAIGKTKFYYTKGNGDTTVTSLQRSIFILSGTELGQSHDYLNTEGSAFANASSLLIAYLNGAAVVQWTRSPYTNYTTYAWSLNTNGHFYSVGCSGTNGVRPAFTLPSDLAISSDGSATFNDPPTITSSTASGTNLGTKAAGFDLVYTVNDADKDSVTVKEYLDNVLQRSFSATLGASNTVQCVTAENWQKVLNGAHTIKVVANDGKADSAAYTVTFTKKVTTVEITLTEPLDADDAITVAVMTLTGSIPDDAVLEVLLTNNAKDPAPVWEDATQSVKNKLNHVFTNATAENGFAFNFKVTITRGASDVGGFITNIGGAFE